MNRTRFLLTMLAALALVAGGLFAHGQVYAGPGCAAHSKSTTASSTDAADATAQTADVKVTKAGATCGSHGDAKQASGQSACLSGAKATYTKADGTTEELLSAEAALSKLAHCGININAVETDVLAAKLAEKKACGSFTTEQWATMINAAKSLEGEKSEVILASVKGAKSCASDACPMSQVAKDLAAVDTEPEKN